MKKRDERFKRSTKRKIRKRMKGNIERIRIIRNTGVYILGLGLHMLKGGGESEKKEKNKRRIIGMEEFGKMKGKQEKLTGKKEKDKR